MIAVIDYGIGNVSSIVNMLKKIGVDSILAKSSLDIQMADKIILPGVGSFDSGMQKLRASGLIDDIFMHALTQQKPTLGICLGMQMLGRSSEEGIEKGLGLIPFDNVKFRLKSEANLKIPHMGWDIVSFQQTDDPILFGIAEPQRYYFVHSYHAVCDSDSDVLMYCDYGYPFHAAVKKGKIYGFQFHPEKSHRYGMKLLENFARNV